VKGQEGRRTKLRDDSLGMNNGILLVHNKVANADRLVAGSQFTLRILVPSGWSDLLFARRRRYVCLVSD